MIIHAYINNNVNITTSDWINILTDGTLMNIHNIVVFSVTDPDDVHKTKQAVADSVLCLTQFSINQVSLEVQSRGEKSVLCILKYHTLSNIYYIYFMICYNPR